jgi:hypothetical protein
VTAGQGGQQHARMEQCRWTFLQVDHLQKGRLDILVTVGDRKHPVGIPVDEPAQPTWTGPSVVW